MKIIKKPSTNFSDRPEGLAIDTLVLHYTGMEDCHDALDRMCDPNFEVSAHYCIDRNGDVYQLVEESQKAWHSGLSYWRGKENVNENSIGIEVVNNGHEWGYQSFPEEQMNAVISLSQQIIERHDIKPYNIVGHSDIAPLRKEDPGEKFPWDVLAKRHDIGIFCDHDSDDINLDDPSYDSHIYTVGEIIDVKKKLADIGYYIHPSDNLDEQFHKVMTAFYRRFFPARIDMQQNTRYPESIYLDGKAIKLITKVAELYKQV